MAFPDRPRLALIAGPTASGKSALAMAIARAQGGTVVNADSAQVYRDLRVLSARPDAADEAAVPHRLFGHVDGAQPYSAAAWARDATHTIDAIHAAGGLPILVGGTGLYLRTLLDGIAPVPDIDPGIRADVRGMAVADALARLQDADPHAAARLRQTDTTRIARALEVVLSTGRSLSAWQAVRTGGIADRVSVSGTLILPDRALLHERIDRRLDAMLAGGAIEEVAALRARGDLPFDAPVRKAIGVAEIAAWQDGVMTLAEAASAAKLATRRYAKRQYTWFRNQSPADWARFSSSEEAIGGSTRN